MPLLFLRHNQRKWFSYHSVLRAIVGISVMLLFYSLIPDLAVRYAGNSRHGHPLSKCNVICILASFKHCEVFMIQHAVRLIILCFGGGLWVGGGFRWEYAAD